MRVMRFRASTWSVVLTGVVAVGCTGPQGAASGSSTGGQAAASSSGGAASTSAGTSAGSSSGGASSSGGSSQGGMSGSGGCFSTQQHFEQVAWPGVVQLCVDCHVAGGAAQGTRYVLKGPAVPDQLAQNAAIFARLTRLLGPGGQPLLLLKPTAQVAHGGGQVVVPASAEHVLLQDAVARAQNPVECPGEGPRDPVEQVTTGVDLLDAYGTLRRASLQLAGRLPTAAEVAAVDAGGLDALDAILMAQMTEPAFFDRVRDIFNDVLLTNAFDSGNGDASLMADNQVDPDVFPYARHFQSAALYSGCEPETPGCDRPTLANMIRTSDALAREPLEFFVHAVKNDLPMRFVITAPHRMVNAYSARLFGLPWDGHAAGDYDPATYDPADFRPAALPGINENRAGATPAFSEYAGVLTTPAWRQRYPNTCTNHNRKIARFTYKYFQNLDIMRNAPRLDLSNVDLSAHPSRNNMQCTGCHTAIDPVAGAYRNWTKCHNAPARHYTPEERPNCGGDGWRSTEEMFPTGVGPGEENVMAAADHDRALELLGAHMADQPGFEEAMVRHLFTGLTGRPPLDPPPDANAVGYVEADLAFDAQQQLLAELVGVMRSSGGRLKPVVVALVKGPLFRAHNAQTDQRLETEALGGGVWTTPEVMDRKLHSVFGAGWDALFQDAHGGGSNEPARGYGMLTRRDRARIFYGGLDARVVLTRQRLPSGLAAATAERMALEMACLHTARDFALPAADRRLFPRVEATVVPAGLPIDPGQAAVVDNLRHLLERFWGLRAGPTDPEVAALHQLLVASYAAADGQALPKVCSGAFDLRSGAPAGSAPAAGTARVMHAWQAAVAYLVTDYAFLFE